MWYDSADRWTNQDVPNYVTESAYPEMINGRTDVGDSQAHRLLAVLDLKANKTLWADASAFAGSEQPAKPGEAAKPRLVDWGRDPVLMEPQKLLLEIKLPVDSLWVFPLDSLGQASEHFSFKPDPAGVIRFQLDQRRTKTAAAVQHQPLPAHRTLNISLHDSPVRARVILPTLPFSTAP